MRRPRGPAPQRSSRRRRPLRTLCRIRSDPPLCLLSYSTHGCKPNRKLLYSPTPQRANSRQRPNPLPGITHRDHNELRPHSGSLRVEHSGDNVVVVGPKSDKNSVAARNQKDPCSARIALPQKVCGEEQNRRYQHSPQHGLWASASCLCAPQERIENNIGLLSSSFQSFTINPLEWLGLIPVSQQWMHYNKVRIQYEESSGHNNQDPVVPGCCAWHQDPKKKKHRDRRKR